MNILLITWPDGENNPFRYFNDQLSDKFNAFGHVCIHIDLDNDFGIKLNEALLLGIDFALTWQGLGSPLRFDDNPLTIWDELKIPLFCLHGDHPCHMPANHSTDSNFVFHLYGVASFTDYANLYIPHNKPAVFFPGSNFFKKKTIQPNGKFFVLPKNLDDPFIIHNEWRMNFSKFLSSFLIETSAFIYNSFIHGESRDHHIIINEMLTDLHITAINNEFGFDNELSAFHYAHALLDKSYRNSLTVYVIEQLADVKLKIVGRGWGRIKMRENKNHDFYDIKNMSDGEYQFESEYGIIDISSTFDGLHDRMLRACAYGSSFLIGSSWNKLGYLHDDHQDIFFNGTEGDLRGKAEKVMQGPSGHREKVKCFSRDFDTNFSFYHFAKYLELLAFIAKQHKQQ